MPRLEEIQKAAQKLGLTAEIVPELAHPSTPWLKTGMAKVTNKGAKLETVRQIAKELAVQRAKQSN